MKCSDLIWNIYNKYLVNLVSYNTKISHKLCTFNVCIRVCVCVCVCVCVYIYIYIYIRTHMLDQVAKSFL
jgi:hypothetical protein